jgi:hypothetical protein
MSGPEMELWASGLNVWNQLSFFADSCEGEGGSGGGVPPAQDPRDVHSFVRVLRGAEVERPLSRLSYTLGMHTDALFVDAVVLQSDGSAQTPPIMTIIRSPGPTLRSL